MIVLLAPFLPDFLAIAAVITVGLVPVIWVVYNYLDWRNDWFVVTNQRVVHEENILLTFNETRQQSPLKSIQQVKTDQDGYLAERLDFGDLIIATAGAGGTLIFDTIRHPEDLAEIINQELSRTGAHRAAESRDKIRSEIDRFIGTRALNKTRAENDGRSLSQVSLSPICLLIRYIYIM